MAAATRSSAVSPFLPHTTLDPSLFPLRSINDVVNFFRHTLEHCAAHGTDPDLTLLSIVAGYVELSLTTGEAAQAAAAAISAAEHAAAPSSSAGNIMAGIVGNATAAGSACADIIMGNTVRFPIVTYEFVSGMYKKFQSILSSVDKPKTPRQATREVIKKVSDIIWNSLIRSSYKDRAHMQNLYSYLSGNKLDCFGVAIAVVAGCQLLNYKDVRLAISEDHAWIVFGHRRLETIEVTWHAKGSEDKRGQDISHGVESGSWLYLRGLAVVCDKHMEVSAIVAAINISLTANSDCMEVAEMQQKLLWILYDMGYLKKYPMALGSLGELEELIPTAGRINCEQIFREGIHSSQEYYRNHHVYPHTYQGNYYNRLLKYREAFAAWANAADVIRLYTYNCRDDEEIYKELLDIANEMIPYVMKTESSGHSARSILRDSEVFANLLRFYDGICQWEEDSLTPILHIGWAKPLVNNITKFDYEIRSQVVIKVAEDGDEPNGKDKDADAGGGKHDHNDAKKGHNNVHSMQEEGNNNNLIKKEEKLSNDIKKVEIPTTLADLTAACGEKILNPEFLLQGGNKPFAEQKQQDTQNNHSHNNGGANGTEKINDIQQGQDQAEIKPNKTININSSAEDIVMQCESQTTKESEGHAMFSPQSAIAALSTSPRAPIAHVPIEEEPFEFVLKRPIITLYSQKMKGLKDLLLAEKLNTHAISLQVTAQSVASKKVRHHSGSVATGAAHHYHHQHNNNNNNHNHHNTAEALADSIAASRPKRTRRE